VSDPSAPVVVGQETGCPYADGVDVSDDGDTVYIACASDADFDGTLRIVDATDRAHPVALGSLRLPGTESLPDYNVAHSVVVAGGTAHVGNEYGLDEIDVSVPAAPVWLARHDTGYPVFKVERAPDGRVFAFTHVAGVFVFGLAPDEAIFANGFDG
jgi:hypothetical protein